MSSLAKYILDCTGVVPKLYYLAKGKQQNLENVSKILTCQISLYVDDTYILYDSENWKRIDPLYTGQISKKLGHICFQCKLVGTYMFKNSVETKSFWQE